MGGLSNEPDLHGAGSALGEGLGGQDVLDLGGADPEGQGSEGPVGGGVAVAADDGLSREGDPLFGGDHMDDPLTGVVHGEVGHAEMAGIVG